jgi:hypothetical protein
MKMNYQDGLLFVSLTLTYQWRTHTIDHVVLDTGAAQSLIDRDAVEPLLLKPALSDEIVTMMGIGGPESALRKRIDQLQFDTYTQYDPWVDFGLLDAHPGINGLLGADVLVSGNFVIDLAEMEAYQQKI